MNSVFENLFVLELANNHWGSLERGLKIIDDFSEVVKANNINAAIKLQFRDVDNFVHASFKDREDIRYVKKTIATKMSAQDFMTMIERIKMHGLIPMSTPFDEKSVDLCQEMNLPIIKIASSDIADKVLVNKILQTGKPTIVSTGGATELQIDEIVAMFAEAKIPLAINHCVSLYPSEDSDLQLNQIDYLKDRYKSNVIGLSTHEYNDWTSSVMIAYAKGARTFERHIDIDYQNVPVSSYCTTPEQADIWFKAFNKAVEMCGNSSKTRREIPSAEKAYLTKLLRGAYAKRDLPIGYQISIQNLDKDFYLAIPLQESQMSCNDVHNNFVLVAELKADEAIMQAKVKVQPNRTLSKPKTLFLNRNSGLKL